MTNRDKAETVMLYMKNSHWRDFYNAAPTENTKKYIELGFIYSKYSMLDDSVEDKELERIREERKQLEEKFTLDDWTFMFYYVGRNPYKGKCYKKICEMVGKENVKVIKE